MKTTIGILAFVFTCALASAQIFRPACVSSTQVPVPVMVYRAAPPVAPVLVGSLVGGVIDGRKGAGIGAVLGALVALSQPPVYHVAPTYAYTTGYYAQPVIYVRSYRDYDYCPRPVIIERRAPPSNYRTVHHVEYRPASSHRRHR